MRYSRTLILIALSAFAAIGPLTAAEPPARPLFADVVRGHFTQWDADGDGTLTPGEVDRLSVDPAWTGDDAAAIATIKLAMRSKKDPIESLALAELAAMASKPLSQDRELSPDQPPEKAAPRNGMGGPDRTRPGVDTLQARFARAARMIRTAKRDLFLDPTPDLDRFHQGRIGDCFFVSIVGAMVERDPESVKTMITLADEPTKSYRVTFGDGRAVTVPPLTDAEFALASTTGDEGMWLPVLEKAFGTLRMESKPEDKRTQSMTDAIARGGSSMSSIQSLTGHRAELTRLRQKKDSPAAADPEAFLASVRAELIAGTEAHRLMGAGTDKEPGVPGISPNHAYAIFGFDAATETLHMWNPHGNAFRPKGTPGPANGYPTRGGRFDIPLRDFIATFRHLVIETDQPARSSGQPASVPSAPRR